jgi:hypothetical protein
MTQNPERLTLPADARPRIARVLADYARDGRRLPLDDVQNLADEIVDSLRSGLNSETAR